MIERRDEGATAGVLLRYRCLARHANHRQFYAAVLRPTSRRLDKIGRLGRSVAHGPNARRIESSGHEDCPDRFRAEAAELKVVVLRPLEVRMPFQKQLDLRILGKAPGKILEGRTVA